MSPRETIRQIAEQCRSDPAQLSRWLDLFVQEAPDICDQIAARKRRAKAILPCPPAAQITALECSIFDNWLAYKRPMKAPKLRYGVTVKIWTAPADAISFQCPDYRYNGSLHDGPELGQRIKRMKMKSRCKAPPSPEYEADLNAISLALRTNGMLVAPMLSTARGEGTEYIDGQFLLFNSVDLSQTSAERAIMKTKSGTVTAKGFVGTDTKGNPFLPFAKGKGQARCILQARNIKDRRHKRGWDTRGPRPLY